MASPQGTHPDSHPAMDETARKARYAAVAARLDPARLVRDEIIAPYTTFRIGGPADLFYTTDSTDDLARALRARRMSPSSSSVSAPTFSSVTAAFAAS